VKVWTRAARVWAGWSDEVSTWTVSAGSASGHRKTKVARKQNKAVIRKKEAGKRIQNTSQGHERG
jgi:hypothetical protein